jgi:hypothetical protein
MYSKNGRDCFHHVTSGLRCVPAKYCWPGTPIDAGEHTKACQTRRFRPSVDARSKLGLRLSQSVSCQWGPIVVKPSAATRDGRRWAALAGCFEEAGDVEDPVLRRSGPELRHRDVVEPRLR